MSITLYHRIKHVVRERMEAQESFTCLDIRNALGGQARYMEAATTVRAMFEYDEMEPYGYTRVLVDVPLENGEKVAAFLYCHQSKEAEIRASSPYRAK